MAKAKVEMVEVAAPEAHVYLGGQVFGHTGGGVVLMPKAHAEELRAAGIKLHAPPLEPEPEPKPEPAR